MRGEPLTAGEGEKMDGCCEGTEKGEGDIEGNNLDGIDDEMKEKPKKKFVWFENIEC